MRRNSRRLKKNIFKRKTQSKGFLKNNSIYRKWSNKQQQKLEKTKKNKSKKMFAIKFDNSKLIQAKEKFKFNVKKDLEDLIPTIKTDNKIDLSQNRKLLIWIGLGITLVTYMIKKMTKKKYRR